MMWIIIVVIVIVLGFLYMKSKKADDMMLQPTTSPSTEMGTATSTADLDAEITSIGAQLDAIDLESMDK